MHTNFALDQLHELARSLGEAGEVDKAKNAYKYILSLHNSDPKALHALGLLNFATCNYEESIHYLGHACACIELKEQIPEMFFKIGYAYSQINSDEKAVLAFTKYLEWMPDAHDTIQFETSSKVRLNLYKALSRKGNRAPQLITENVSLWGCGMGLTEQYESEIKSALDKHFSNWETGKTSYPWRSGTNIITKQSGYLKPETKVMFVSVARIHCSPEYMHSELMYYLAKTAEELGLNFKFHAADDFSYQCERSQDTLKKGLQELESSIAEFRPDILLWDGNFIPSQETISVEQCRELKHKYRIKWTTLVGDCYDGAPNTLEEWADVSDKIIIYVPNSTIQKAFTTKYPEKLNCLTSFPYYQPIFSSAGINKDIDFFYAGSNHRQRDVFLTWVENYLKEDRRNVFITAHQKKLSQALPIEEYGSTFARSKLTFNSGYVDGSNWVCTGRVFEAILAKTLCLHEGQHAVDELFVPFVHFFPISGAQQLVLYSRFFLKNEQYRSYMVEQAHDFYLKHYSSEKVWEAMLSLIPQQSDGIENKFPVSSANLHSIHL